MELSFITKSIREICERNEQATDVFGTSDAQVLHDALAELRAAPTIGDIADWNGRMLPIEKGHLAFHFGETFDITFKANHVRNPTDTDGSLVWEKVSSIKILKVEIKNAEHD